MTTATRRVPSGQRYGHDPLDRAALPDPKIILLRERVQLVAERLAEIDARLPQINRDGAEGVELLMERADLENVRRVTTNALADAEAPPDLVAGEQRKRIIDAEVRTRRSNLLGLIRKYEVDGDWRQARIWRMELLDLRAQVEAEIK